VVLTLRGAMTVQRTEVHGLDAGAGLDAQTPLDTPRPPPLRRARARAGATAPAGGLAVHDGSV
jgi:hypothetical protein